MENYIVIDLEMTGLNPKQDAILEVGAVRVRDRQVVETLSFFVNPNHMLTSQVMDLTGITPDMIADGETPSNALKRTMEFIGDDIWVGHNVIFDYSFLKQLAVNERISFEKKAVDTLKLARVLLDEPAKKTLDSLCIHFKIDRENCHRALDDAMATAQLYRILEDRYLGERPRMFEPQPLIYNPKIQQPASKVQIAHLLELVEYHGIILDMPLETLTRSEASRLYDRLVTQYGRIPKI